MNDANKCGVVMGIIFLIWLAILIHVLSGCQTMGGLCRDIESAARYGHEHVICDR